MQIERNPSLGWPYDAGIGVAYRFGTETRVNVEVITEHWATKNYFLVLIYGETRSGETLGI